MQKISLPVLLGWVVSLQISGCSLLNKEVRKDAANVPDAGTPTEDATFDVLAAFLGKCADSVVLEGDAGSKVLVSPRLQGRILTLRVGAVESTGYLNISALAKGEVDPHFNNFGGADRFWIYPEAGQFGIYFDPGAEFDRKVWKVPPDLDRGGWTVVSKDSSRILMARDLQVRNYIGTQFKARVEREVTAVRTESLPAELGVKLPEGVAFAGAATRNVLTNADSQAWSPQTGLIGIWILGMFNPSDSAAVIAPFRPGVEKDFGPAFNDEYFGKVSVDTPERLKVVDGAVVMKADARHVGKFGISQQRTTGLAGAMDFKRSLLTIVKFSVPPLPERYGNSTWVKNQAEPFKGDAFQTYNSGPADPGSSSLAEAPFFELESTSPVRPLSPGESLTHLHSTFHFQGDITKLSAISKQLLGVKLEAVRAALKL